MAERESHQIRGGGSIPSPSLPFPEPAQDDRLQAVMDRRHELFRRAVLGGQEALLPAFRQANREYVQLRLRERRSPEGRQKQLPLQIHV